MTYGLLGRKLGHSYSKVIHESIMDYQYDMIEKEPDQLEQFFKEKSFSAINVTVPYKKDVIPYLDEIDERAQKIGAVNTIVNRNGKLYGYNTDFDGVIELIHHENVIIENKNVLILGTGGTSNTVYAVCQYLKAKSIVKVSRGSKRDSISYEEALQRNETEVIINTTPCGMFPDNYSCPMEIDEFDNLEAVIDVIYNPFQTVLIRKAKQKGLKGNGGFYMLVAQAVKAIEHFKDIKLSDDLIEQIYNQLYQQKCNIVLIGMPGCGKSTIGKLLAEKTDKELIDTDAAIVQQAGMSIPEIFAQQGEKCFRDLEQQACQQVSKRTGAIISTGGGAILRKENVEALKQNGVIIYLKRDVEKLQSGNGRPLSKNIEDNKKRYSERKEIYESSCDFIIDNNDSIEQTMQRIEEYLNENFSH